MTTHLFSVDEYGIQLKAGNAVDVSEFLAGTHFEYRGDNNSFRIPVFGADDLIVKEGQWLVKGINSGVYRVVDDKNVEFGSEKKKSRKKAGKK